MTTYCVLEINDLQLSVFDHTGQQIHGDSGAASTANGDLVFGAAAWRYSRTDPLKFNSRYFSNINADAVSGDLGAAKNHADLIYHHLRHANLPEAPAVLGVAGYLNNQQLGLLLGICKEAGITVAGFVDSAVAHCAATRLPSDFHVLDVELHRMALSRFDGGSDYTQMQQCVALDGLGVVNIIDGWMNVAADEFVQKTRFDPLHAGASEQQLFDQIYGWLGDRELIDRRVSVAHGDANREIEVPQRLLLAKLAQRLNALDLSRVGTLAATYRVQQVPGLCQLLSGMVQELVMLPAEAALTGYLELGAELNPEQVTRITRTPRRARVSSTVVEADEQHRPTHLLRGHQAFAIAHEMFEGRIDAATGAVLDPQLIANGRTGPGHPLRLGDTITLDKREFVAIRVDDGHG